MNGYGQGLGQPVTPEQYAQALQTYDALKQKQDHQQAMIQTRDPFAILGAALGGALSRKFGKHKGANITDVEQQIAAFQEQKQAELAQIAEAKAAREAEQKRAQFLADKKAEREFELKKMLTGKQFDVDNRAPAKPDKPSWEQQRYNMMTPEQQAAYLNNTAGIKQQGGQLFTPQEQALIQAGKVTPEQVIQKKTNDVLGVKPETAGEREKAKNKETMLDAVNKLDSMVEKHGTEYWGTDAKLMKTVHTDLMLSLKEAANLGVLSGSDLELVNSLVNDPTALTTQMNPNGAKNIRAQLNYLKEKYGSLKPEKQENQQDQLTPQGMEQTQQLLNKYLSE